MRPVVRAVHDIFIGPLKIEGIDEGLAQTSILEFFAPHIDEPPLRPGRRVIRDHRSLDAAILERRKIVTRGPGSRRELLPEQIALRSEAFETDLPVPVVFVTDSVEIIQSARDRQIGTPPVLNPIEFDVMPNLKAPNLVGAAAQRNFKRRLIERLLGIINSRENWEPGDKQRHVARTPLGKTYNNRAVIGRFRAFAVTQLLRDDRVTLFLQSIDGPRHVVSRQRRTVVKLRLRPQSKPVNQSVVGYSNYARGQSVHRVRLVPRTHHQRREGKVHPERTLTFEDVAVERRESQKRPVIAT